MGLCRIIVDMWGTDTLAVESAGMTVEYARTHGGSIASAKVIVDPGKKDEREEVVVKPVKEHGR